MGNDSLKERMLAYEEISNNKLTKKLPLIISLNGRGFRKTTSFLTKPYCTGFSSLMGKVLVKLASDIEGATFLYSFNDEIHILCFNDQSIETEAWYDNNIQKIVSATASMASLSLYDEAIKQNIQFLGDPVFLSKVFILPSSTEVINYFISKQNEASNSAISMACFYELLKNNNPDKVLKMLKNITVEEKYDLLTKQCKVDIKNYPIGFWRGIACYRSPKLIETNIAKELRSKLIIDDELPFFHKNQSFLYNILKKY